MKVRTGRWLPPIDAVESLKAFPDVAEWHDRLTAAGFILAERVRPYLAIDRRVTFRFVWRKRSDNLTVTHEHLMRIPLADVRASREAV